MIDAQWPARAAAPLAGLIRDITPDQLSTQTPCAEYDVRKLVNHLLFWGPSVDGAGRKEAVAPPAGAETDLDLTRGDWRAALDAQVERTVATWSRPGAWEGTTHMGAAELPAPLVGAMVVGELVLHGWDLARATGQHPAWDDDLIAYLHEETAKNAGNGREMGFYGPEVPIPASSPLLDRLLGLTGRDPAWGR